VDSVLVDEAGLAAWGRDFARTLRSPVVVGISGELGAGKTTLVRAIAAALGVEGPVTSPTFALVHRYTGTSVQVWHVDAYRLRHEDDARDLGFAEMLAEPDAVVLVEWPERLGAAMPPADREVRLAYTGDDGTRRIEW